MTKKSGGLSSILQTSNRCLIVVLTVFVASCLVRGGPNQANAAEGAASNYFPGAYGSLLIGVAPEPGPVLASLTLFYRAEADRAVPQGRANTDIEIDALYTLAQGFYVWDAPLIGGRFAIGGYLPVGYASLDSSLQTATGTVSKSDDEVGLSDIGLIPASFFWNTGNFHFNLYELVIVPTGEYKLDNAVNIGRNYWSFDTVFAATWFNEKSGTEISIVPGFMYNTENSDTNYQTGTEFHLDLAVNQFVSENFAIGVHGYGYKQIEGDSGSGAILGDFKGESYGLGLAVSWIPEFGAGRFAVSGKWLHDLHSTNRMEADYGALTISLTF
jgi:hypothetical protein